MDTSEKSHGQSSEIPLKFNFPSLAQNLFLICWVMLNFFTAYGSATDVLSVEV